MAFLKKLFGNKSNTIKPLNEQDIAQDFELDSKHCRLTDLEKPFEYVTDTSTICVFDVANLKHRLDDTGDWWSIPEDEVLELNKGNLIIAALPEDGKYKVSILDEFKYPFDFHLSVNLCCDSGEVFIGAGEHITGDETEPKDWKYLGGRLMYLEQGNYKVDLYLFELYKIAVTFTKNSEVKLNNFSLPLELRDGRWS